MTCFTGKEGELLDFALKIKSLFNQYGVDVGIKIQIDCDEQWPRRPQNSKIDPALTIQTLLGDTTYYQPMNDDLGPFNIEELCFDQRLSNPDEATDHFASRYTETALADLRTLLEAQKSGLRTG